MTRWILALSLLTLAACGGPLEYEVDCPPLGQFIQIEIDASEDEVRSVDFLLCAESEGCQGALLPGYNIQDRTLFADPSCQEGQTVRITVWL